jgi:glycosyltransferase involved in cell wall biosynthesis
MKVDIILASYNGEEYIAEFIESLIKQTYKTWQLIISDDGSQDNTVNIIKHYITLDSRIILVNQARQGGVVKNFNSALAYARADYIMFADQDDVWLSDKLEKSIKKIREEEIGDENRPLLLFTDLTLVDENLKTIAPSFYRHHRFDPLNNTSKTYLSWCSTLYGCTILFNRALLKVVYPIDDRVIMHDQIFAFFASLLGKVIFLDERTVLYRQHNSNVIGGVGKKLIYKVFRFIDYYGTIKSYCKKIISQSLFIKEKISIIGLNRNDVDFLDDLLSSNPLRKLVFWKTCIQPFLRERIYLNLLLSWFLLTNFPKG